MAEYRQCRRCLMDTSTKFIEFDGDGICSYCHSYANFEAGDPHEHSFSPNVIAKQINEIKHIGRDRKYDCILGISGGVDSSYLCHLLKRWKLRPLLVHFDNNWNTQLAEDNIAAMVNGTGFDLYRYKVDWREYKALQRAYFRASVVDVEALTDHAAIAVLYREAEKNGIKHVIIGQNYSTEYAMPPDWNYPKYDLVNIRAICGRFSEVPMETFPSYDITYAKKNFVPVAPLQYVNFVKERSIGILEKEYGWKPYPYKHYESLFTWFYQAYYLPEKFGIDKRKVHLSNLIWSHQLTRDQALDEMKKPLVSPENQYLIGEVVKKLGFNDNEWQDIMDAAPVSHETFPHMIR